MLRGSLNALLVAGVLLWLAINLFKPDQGIARRLHASERQTALLQYHAVDTASLWQLQLSSFGLPHPLVPNRSALVSASRHHAPACLRTSH